MRIYTHPACLLHDTGPGHAERPQRLRAVTEALREAFPKLDWREAPRASRGQLLRAHAPELLDTVLEFLLSEISPQSVYDLEQKLAEVLRVVVARHEQAFGVVEVDPNRRLRGQQR